MSDPATARKVRQDFVAQVVAVAPRIAVFDCDGTLWAGDSGQDFFYYELDRGLIPNPIAEWARARYAEYLQGKVDETTMCGEMVTIHGGVAEEKVIALAAEFFRSQVQSRIFPEMLELTHQLAVAGCEVWTVSSTNAWVVREGVRRFGIPAEHVLAACVEVERGYCTRRLVAVPSGEGKAAIIRAHIPAPPGAAFGNSVHDIAMLRLAQHAFAINPTAELEGIARSSGWTIYHPPPVR